MLTRSDEGHGEYLSDMILHGLRFSEHEVIDYPRTWYMYHDDLTKDGYDPVGKVSGNGFTIFGTLPDDSNIDRTDISNKIISKYFDYVIFQRCDYNYDLEGLVFEHYPPNKIILLDGHDINHLFANRVGKGIYFKRELDAPISNVYPISFAFPKEKINMYLSDKTKLVSDIIPGQTTLGTYKFTTEESYYREYATSCFAVTMKKSGWDCMRHYEIIANMCLPIFQNIESCPAETMKTLPKHLFIEINKIIDQKGAESFISGNGSAYYEMNSKVFTHFVNNCTTEKLAQYMMQTVKDLQ